MLELLKSPDFMNLKYKLILLTLLVIVFCAILFGITAHNQLVMNFDAETAQLFSTFHSSFLDNFALAITQVGNTYPTAIIFLILGLFLIIKKKKYSFYIFSIATGLGITLVEAMKVSIERIRPPMHLLIETGYSFPSGHSTISTIYLLSAIILIAPLLANRFSKIVWITLCSIIFPLVALSRIYLSVHFASDVAAGIILGAACFLFANTVTFHHHSYKKEAE